MGGDRKEQGTPFHLVTGAMGLRLLRCHGCSMTPVVHWQLGAPCLQAPW